MRHTRLEVKGILFDLDGTIVDSKGAYMEAARTAFAVMKHKPVNTRIVTEIPKRLEQDIPIDDLIPDVDAKKFREIYLNAYYQATPSRTKPFPNIGDTLNMLSERAKLALTTRRNVSRKEVLKELENFGLAKYFQIVLTSMDTRDPKPSPEALDECTRRLDLKIGDCAVVGDSVIDIRAGKNAGAKTVAVLSGIFSRKELEREKPDLILENVNKLPKFLG
jgi:HAD superfamily hydrolase (TIGR01509 family)